MPSVFARILFLACFILSARELPAECIINARTDKNTVIVGDEINLSISLKYREGEHCLIGDDVNFQKFRLLKKEVRTEKAGGYITDNYSFVLTPLELGEVLIPPLKVHTSEDAGYADDEGPIETPEIKINVQGVIAGEQDAKIKDILPPEKVYERTYLLLYIIAGIVGAALFAFFLVRYLKKRKTKVAEETKSRPAEPELSPYEEAMLSLKILEDERLISKFMYKELYLRLTEILKRFIERFYGFNAVEMTTSELMLYLMDHPQPNLDIAEMKDFLLLSDLVKFAKYTPEPESAYRDFNNVRNIISKAARHITGETAGDGGKK